MDGNIWFWLGMFAILIYLLVGYTVIDLSKHGLDSKEFGWNFKTIGCIIGWGPFLIFSYIILKLSNNTMFKSKKPEDRDSDDDSSYH